ncbi:MAG: putative 2-oxoglutarate/Fe(II)-dependent dioxygenase YbiX [Alcanivorax sp.]|jgi:predicted 2-oxoglutarate/Fe(II)-dependent dioxygenase YbiX
MTENSTDFDIPPLFALIDNVITPEEKDGFFTELEALESKPAGLVNWDGTRSSDARIRRSNNTDLKSGHWLARRMYERIQELNEQLWGMSLLVPERVQILDYSQQGHYIWHFDVLPTEDAEEMEGGEGTNRVLSAVLNLTDESEYTMGDLVFHDPVAGIRTPGLHGCGNMVVFPSSHWHRATSVTSGFRRVAVIWVRGRIDVEENAYIGEFTKTMRHATLDTAVPAGGGDGPVGVSSEEGLMVYKPYTNNVHVLDGIAGWIWEAQVKKVPVGDLVSDLASHFGAPKQQIQDDVDQLNQDWKSAGILPESATLIDMEPEQEAESTQLCSIASTLIQIGYNDKQVELLLRPLLQPLEVAVKASPIRQISVIELPEGHAVRIDQGSVGIIKSAAMAVANILSELYSIAPISGGASLSIGGGALGVSQKAILMPGLLNSGRSALLYAMASQYNYDFLCGSSIPFYRGNGTIEAMPMPVKLRQADIELLGDRYAESPALYGTESDQIRLIPAPVTQNDGRRYSPSLIVFARYDAAQKTTLTELDAMDGLSRLMAAGSYFIQGVCYEDVMQVFKQVKRIPIYELCFSDLESAFKALDPVLEEF